MSLSSTPFRAQLTRLGACGAARDWVGERDAETAWRECPRGDWLAWLVARLGCDLGWLDAVVKFAHAHAAADYAAHAHAAAYAATHAHTARAYADYADYAADYAASAAYAAAAAAARATDSAKVADLIRREVPWATVAARLKEVTP